MAVKSIERFFLDMHPLQRILISLLLSGLAFVLIRQSGLNDLGQLLVVWDVFALSYTITCWIIIFKRSTTQIRQVATKQDGSRAFVFFIILLASFASLFTVLMLLVSNEPGYQRLEYIYLPVAIFGMLLSWLMVHTTFAFHYAHLYYNNDNDQPADCAKGLNFPDEDDPDYLDFAYFSFVIGMTFQVSDVEISSKTIRRSALGHALLSFGLNTFVVALTINVIAGLKK